MRKVRAGAGCRASELGEVVSPGAVTQPDNKMRTTASNQAERADLIDESERVRTLLL